MILINLINHKNMQIYQKELEMNLKVLILLIKSHQIFLRKCYDIICRQILIPIINIASKWMRQVIFYLITMFYFRQNREILKKNYGIKKILIINLIIKLKIIGLTIFLTCLNIRGLKK